MQAANDETGSSLERLGPDDEAQRTAERFLDQALELRRRSALSLGGIPGVCSNCGEACLPTAVYCDPDCRADHEARVCAAKRLRGS